MRGRVMASGSLSTRASITARRTSENPRTRDTASRSAGAARLVESATPSWSRMKIASEGLRAPAYRMATTRETAPAATAAPRARSAALRPITASPWPPSDGGLGSSVGQTFLQSKPSGARRSASGPPTASRRWRRAVLLILALAGVNVRAHADETPVLPVWAPLETTPTAIASGSVAPFVVDLASEAGQRAVSCLTDAVYYEAATETRDGKEAVAQVVLNRVRHPSFPKSVCGVVYQGVGTGAACQFSFACDGSMARAPVPELWRSAEEVAAAALSGHVATRAGASTHYHAGWARPYWRSSLVETGRIGTQVFYRMPGSLGSARVLTAAYAGVESASRPTIRGRAPRVILAHAASGPKPEP